MRRRGLVPILGSVAAIVAVAAPVVGVTVGREGARHAGATIEEVGGDVIGWARLVEDGDRTVHVNVHVKGLPPGRHGIHLHAVGACHPSFAAAGGHYNPLGHQHGLLNPSGAHAGDLPNLVVNEDGVGVLSATTDRVTLTDGPATLFDANGSAFIIHANEDDQVTDATNGNSGSRIACGVIVAERG